MERAAGLFAGSRGKGLQPRTLEVFDDLGVIDEVLAAGAQFPAFRLYAGHDVVWEQSLLQMLGAAPVEPGPDTPYPLPWLLPQWRTDEIFAERLAGLGGLERADPWAACRPDSGDAAADDLPGHPGGTAYRDVEG